MVSRRINIIRLLVHSILVTGVIFLLNYNHLQYHLLFLKFPLITASVLAIVLLSNVKFVIPAVLSAFSVESMLAFYLLKREWQLHVINSIPYFIEIILISMLMPKSIKISEVDRIIIWIFILNLCVDALVFLPIYANDLVYFLVEIIPSRSVRYLTTALLVPLLTHAYFLLPRLLNLANNRTFNTIRKRTTDT